ncbi:hypothetical protein RJ641_015782 [Dillenia turbinata]|uniref:Uncharacterized protein n=1 Tax=Dillenia turbinata TaxID=194707 RepID=A0AAN8Z415_9MAGN
MDKKSPTADIAEIVRDSLIAISQTPEVNCCPPKLLPKTSKNENQVNAILGDAAEKYRSELISISYLESPDTKTLPAMPRMPGKLEGALFSVFSHLLTGLWMNSGYCD